MSIIAIDCGASFLKGARIKESGEIEQILIVQSPDKTLETGEKRIEQIVQKVIDIICELAGNSNDVKVCISNEMHGFVVTDSAGTPYIDYVSWQNECAYENLGEYSYLEHVAGLLNEDEILSTGMPLKVGLPNVNLFYALNNELHGIDKSEMYFYTLGEFLIRTISGKQPYIHCTNAAATGLYNMYTGGWHEGIIEKLDMKGIHFPVIYNDQKTISAMLNDICVHLYPAIGDQQAALLGSGITEDCVSINLGTGGQVSRLVSKLDLSQSYQTRPYFGNYYLQTIPHIPSGRALNVYFGFIKEIVSHFADVDETDIWNYIMEQAKKDSSGDLRIDMSFFTNALTPHKHGMIADIGEDNFTCGNLFHSIYKQMAENIVLLIERIGGENIHEIVFSGGVAAKNAMLRNMILEKFVGVTYSVAENETLLGLYKYIDIIDNISL